MSKLTQVQKVIAFLKAHPRQKFTARQIAEAITQEYAADYQNKKAKFADEKAFLRQIVAEIGARKEDMLKTCPDIQMQHQPRPRLYWYETEIAAMQPSKPDEITDPKHYPNGICIPN